MKEIPSSFYFYSKIISLINNTNPVSLGFVLFFSGGGGGSRTKHSASLVWRTCNSHLNSSFRWNWLNQNANAFTCNSQPVLINFPRKSKPICLDVIPSLFYYFILMWPLLKFVRIPTSQPPFAETKKTPQGVFLVSVVEAVGVEPTSK